MYVTGILPEPVRTTEFNYTDRLAGPLLRITLGVVLLWIGCIHVVDPQPVVTLLSQSLPFLAFTPSSTCSAGSK
jgi:hypothetical protein